MREQAADGIRGGTTSPSPSIPLPASRRAGRGEGKFFGACVPRAAVLPDGHHRTGTIAYPGL
jgi:hypothetical protein